MVNIAKNLKCDACEASGLPPPRPFVGFEPPPQKYEICESDFGEWEHQTTGITAKFQVNVDIKTKLRCGGVAFEQEAPRNINSEDAWELYLRSWHQYFGHPKVLRVDPDGAWKANKNLEKGWNKKECSLTWSQAKLTIGLARWRKALGRSRGRCRDKPEQTPPSVERKLSTERWVA